MLHCICLLLSPPISILPSSFALPTAPPTSCSSLAQYDCQVLLPDSPGSPERYVSPAHWPYSVLSLHVVGDSGREGGKEGGEGKVLRGCVGKLQVLTCFFL